MLFLPKEVETVITTLQGAGYSPYLVGGCVREMLRGKAPSDYDMTSDALPQEVLRLFGEWAHPTGLQHGTVTVVSGGLPIELTTMRRDGAYRDNRHPDSVTFGTSIEEDLARRDFTVNAIALSPDGTLVDPYGGQEDLKAGVLRCVGEPKRRFEEDALRILRLRGLFSPGGVFGGEGAAPPPPVGAFLFYNFRGPRRGRWWFLGGGRVL